MPELQFHMKLINTIAFLALATTAVLVGTFEGYHRISDVGFSIAINLLLYTMLGGLAVYKWLPNAPKGECEVFVLFFGSASRGVST